MNSEAAVLNPLAAQEVETRLDVERIRANFPILKQKVHGKPLVYLDNAATSQKPQAVLDALLHFYTTDCSNINRGEVVAHLPLHFAQGVGGRNHFDREVWPAFRKAFRRQLSPRTDKRNVRKPHCVS